MARVVGEGGKTYRERAEAERKLAATTTLPNIRNRALYAAERWDEVAHRAELVQAATAERSGR